MVRIVKRILNKARHLLTIGANHFIYYIKTSSDYKLSINLKYAIINLDDQLSNYDMGRFLFILSKICEGAELNIVVKTNSKYYKKISRYKKPLLKEKFLFVWTTKTPINSIQVVIPGQEEKLIRLIYGFDALKSSHDCVAAFPLHPEYYKEYPSEVTLEKFRNSSRKMQIFFSGNTNPEKYQRDEIKSFFNVNNRVDVLTSVKNNFNRTSIQVISDKQALYELLDGKHEIKPVVISETKSDKEDWLKLLSQSNFFLCPPGVYMPWCHNLTECMSVGTIPILEYAHLCAPPLIHLENCLTFSGLDGLHKTIELALSLEPQAIERIRQNVIKYYNNHLSLETVSNKIKYFMLSDKKVITVAVPFIPIESRPISPGRWKVRI